MYNSFHSVKTVEKSASYRFGSCAKYPLIVSVNDEKSQETSTEITSSKLPINRVLLYLVTREKKYKPKVYTI
jgi:hypothetical protein